MGQSVAQVCLMSTYYHFMVIITIPLLLLLWLSLPYHHCYCYSILFLERRVMRQTEGLFDVYSWLLFSDHNSHSSLNNFRLLLLTWWLKSFFYDHRQLLLSVSNHNSPPPWHNHFTLLPNFLCRRSPSLYVQFYEPFVQKHKWNFYRTRVRPLPGLVSYWVSQFGCIFIIRGAVLWTIC